MSKLETGDAQRRLDSRVPAGSHSTFATNAQIISLGGSTEASIWSVIYPIDQVDSQWRSIPYGSAMLNQRLYVVDNDLRLCPMGEVGELCLAESEWSKAI